MLFLMQAGPHLVHGGHGSVERGAMVAGVLPESLGREAPARWDYDC